jgi:hypothetical protein
MEHIGIVGPRFIRCKHRPFLHQSGTALHEEYEFRRQGLSGEGCERAGGSHVVGAPRQSHHSRVTEKRNGKVADPTATLSILAAARNSLLPTAPNKPVSREVPSLFVSERSCRWLSTYPTISRRQDADHDYSTGEWTQAERPRFRTRMIVKGGSGTKRGKGVQIDLSVVVPSTNRSTFVKFPQSSF